MNAEKLYDDLKDLITKTNDKKLLLDTIQAFYDTELQPEWSTVKSSFDDATTEKLKETLKNLAVESVNMDYINYIKSGNILAEHTNKLVNILSSNKENDTQTERSERSDYSEDELFTPDKSKQLKKTVHKSLCILCMCIIAIILFMYCFGS